MNSELKANVKYIEPASNLLALGYLFVVYKYIMSMKEAANLADLSF